MPHNSSTAEPWLFTPSEMSRAFFWGLLAGALASAPIWVCAGIHLAEFVSHG